MPFFPYGMVVLAFPKQFLENAALDGRLLSGRLHNAEHYRCPPGNEGLRSRRRSD